MLSIFRVWTWNVWLLFQQMARLTIFKCIKNEIETDFDYIFCLTSKPNGFFLTVITFTERKLLHNVKMREMALHILMRVGVNFLECAFMMATCCRDARERDFVSWITFSPPLRSEYANQRSMYIVINKSFSIKLLYSLRDGFAGKLMWKRSCYFFSLF